LNRRGLTLVEVVVAGTLFLLAVSCFNYLSKISMNYVARAGARSVSLYSARSEMEKVRRLSFGQLASYSSAETKIVQMDADLCLIQVGNLYTLRSCY